MLTRLVALALSIWSHGPAAGQPSDRCFTARARHFENYLRPRDGLQQEVPQPRPSPPVDAETDPPAESPRLDVPAPWEDIPGARPKVDRYADDPMPIIPPGREVWP